MQIGLDIWVELQIPPSPNVDLTTPRWGRNSASSQTVISNKGGLTPGARRKAGAEIAKGDFEVIMSKLARDPKSGKIIEKIQIYTHSRGSAFGEGYTAQLMHMISENAHRFENPNNVNDFSLNLAPHQSNSINAVKGVPTVGMSHILDPLSGDDINGAVNLVSNNGVHGNGSFVDEVSNFLSSFLSNEGQVSQSTIDNFVTNMKKRGIDVKVSN